MSPDVWRCPHCGALALSSSHIHRRDCVYGVTPAHELALARALPEPPDYRTPQEDEET